MKTKLYLTATFFITIVSLLGCTKNREIKPSQKSEKHTQKTQNNDEEKRFLQRKLDNWLKNEWEPTVEKDENIKKKYPKKEEKPFTLQEYVDKAALYIKTHPSDTNNSMVEHMKSLPVIGK